MLLPQTEAAMANVLAQRLLEEISLLALEADGHKFVVTASMGIAECLSVGDSLPRLLKRSDDALYKAKRDGRNRVVIWTPSME